MLFSNLEAWENGGGMSLGKWFLAYTCIDNLGNMPTNRIQETEILLTAANEGQALVEAEMRWNGVIAVYTKQARPRNPRVIYKIPLFPVPQE